MKQTDGVIISVGEYLAPFVGALCESIREFMGDIPICLYCDTKRQFLREKNIYGVSTIHENDIQHPWLREHGYGYGFTKMVAFWECPFETFIHFDADMLLYGDLRERFNQFPDADFIANSTFHEKDEKNMLFRYYDHKKLSELTQTFSWEDLPFFNSGVFWSRRGILNLERYIELRKIRHNNPNVFFCGDQGMLNFMIYEGALKQRIQYENCILQVIPPNEREEDLIKKYILHSENIAMPCVFHWQGPRKPWTYARGVFAQSMTEYRVVSFLNTYVNSWILGALVIRILDIMRWVAGFRGGTALNTRQGAFVKTKIMWRKSLCRRLIK